MQKTRLAVVITLVAATLAISFLAPKVKYKSTDFLSRINVPFWLEDWQSRDISYQLDLDDPTYGFAGNVFARLYNNRYGENLAFLILDAGNFHNPKVCFGASGYTMKELPDLELTVAGNRRLEAKTIYAGKGGEGYLLVYWICINKEVVDWTKQKAIQLWYSMFNKKKVGLMARLDIPSSEDNINGSLKLAREFIEDISGRIPQEESAYIFGK